MMSYIEIKVKGAKEEAGNVWVDGICLPKKPFSVISSAFQGIAEYLPTDEK